MLHHFMKLIAITGLFFPAFSLIVWEGKIVPEWPDQDLAALGKGTAGSPPAAASPGFGFYSAPKGTIYGLTMIVDFSDQVAAFTVDQVKAWLNSPGYSTGGCKGSVHDFYVDCSNGKLDLQNDVVGYYRAQKPKSYYEGLSGYSGATALINEMMTHFDPTVDFSKYDNDKNGTTEAINFVYAGSGQTYAQGLWPHSGSINQTKDGIRVGRYNMCDMGNSLGLYVFCHETGHMIFGWPDLYWFGDYCIMGNRMSETNPEAINDFYRADQGWIPTVDITAATNQIFRAWPNGASFRYVNPSKASEMFLWSNVRNTGQWSNLRGKGILLYHFDKTIGSNNSGTSRSLFVVEADGNNAMANAQWPNPGSAATDFFYQGNKAEFSSAWGLKIYNISAIADTMSFTVGTGTVAIHRYPGCLQPVSTESSFGVADLFDLRGVRITRSANRQGIVPVYPFAPGIYLERVSERDIKVFSVK
jgi:M6 family metalloprotease-like protein